MNAPQAPYPTYGVLVIRPEYEVAPAEASSGTEATQSRSLPSRLVGSETVRKLTILLAIVAAWQAYTVLAQVDPLVFPSFSQTLVALLASITSGDIPSRVLISLETLIEGYLAGLVCASVLTILAVRSALGRDLLGTLTAMFNPLPAIALVPLAMLWFGLGPLSLIFVVANSVLWAVALNVQSGFASVSETFRMVGRNYGIKGIPFVYKILIPAAFPSILAGLKIGWAFAWRTLIAAELVFGANQGSGGLGWFIFENSQNLLTPKVFAGLLTVMIIGVVVENGIFQVIESRSVRRWGMQS